ncbi:MAG: hypothetical protein R2709_07200 [Marmoricola sp.]
MLNLEIIKALDEAMVGREVSFERNGSRGTPVTHSAKPPINAANAAAQAFKSVRRSQPRPGFAAGGEHPPLAEQPSLWDDDSTVPERDEDQVAAAASTCLKLRGREVGLTRRTCCVATGQGLTTWGTCAALMP